MDISRKRSFKGLVAVALAAVTALTIGTVAPSTAKAAADAIVPGDVTITKTYNSNPIVQGTFTYTATPITVDGVAYDSTNKNMPAWGTAATITFDGTQTAVATNTSTLTYPTAVVGGTAGTNFLHAGEYIYDIKEAGTTTATGGGTLTNDTTVYRVHVFVGNTTVEGVKGLEITKVGVYKVGGTTQDPTYTKVDASATGKGFAFTNYYVENEKLNITKTVANTYGDKTKEFSLDAVLTLPASVVTKPAKITGTVYTNDTATSKTVDFTLDTGTGTYKSADGFTLTDGQSLRFTDIPSGTTYTVTEAGTTDYTASGKATSAIDGTQSSIITGTLAAGAALSSNTQTVYSTTDNSANVCAVTNTYKDVSPTGIIIQNLPFIIMGLVAVGGIALLAVSRRRKNDRA